MFEYSKERKDKISVFALINSEALIQGSLVLVLNCFLVQFCDFEFSKSLTVFKHFSQNIEQQTQIKLGLIIENNNDTVKCCFTNS